MKKAFYVIVLSTIMTFCSYGISEAVHFNPGGTSTLSGSNSISLTLMGTCNYDYDGGTETFTIQPDGDEKVGDAVIVSWCLSATGTTNISGEGYAATGGAGDSSTSAACSPSPTYSCSNPSTGILNPGAGQKVIFSLGPYVLSGNDSLSLNKCGSFRAKIGDTLQFDGGVFALLTGPGADSGTNASVDSSWEMSVSLAPPPIPVLSDLGILSLVILLGGGSIYYLNRRRVVRI